MKEEALNEQQVEEALSKLQHVIDEVGKVIVGQQDVIEELLICILAGGHCLLEGVPGLAKTLMVSSLAKTLELDFNRVQFTPDLMPSDIVGTEILETDHDSGDRFFKFQQGPVFTNILLADEINRTPPKTQAALLEAMQEKSVSYGGKAYQLPQPFFVLATQNPVEQAGTYPLPEAQLDRFLMLVRVGYPSASDEIEILKRTTGNLSATLSKVLSGEAMLVLQKLTRSVEISDALVGYVTDIVRATRTESEQKSSCEKVNEYIRWGAGPRAGQALVLCSKAKALLSGRYAVTLDDINFVAYAVLRHRMLLNFQAEAESISTDDVIKALLTDVKKPISPLV
ncbi:MoxR family ATPase [Thalassotalea sp. SU-HH00458]|uniref:AAA family ATPase n=1 Tax=Thalassotalea sp. SU-HH00458 TaxID=3127657 RepID=UPI003102D3BB